MFKKFFSYSVFVTIVIFFIIFIFFSSILRHHYIGGNKFHTFQKIALFFAEIPSNIKMMIKKKNININQPEIFTLHQNKDRFKQFVANNRIGLLVLPRYDHSQGRSQVDIIDLKNFKTIHTYKHNIKNMNQIIKNTNEFKRHLIDNPQIRFEYRHPLILEDGSLISHSEYTPLFKIDICSNLVWLNEEEAFHHSLEFDHEKNIWVPIILNPYSKYVDQKTNQLGFYDDAIVKINTKGKILFKKSVIEILAENKLLDENFIKEDINLDPIHLNDIEPVFNDSKYWKKGDLFLSLRHKSSIIHYRPEENKVIHHITGPFAQQHDVDIISSNEISIFNNNNFIIDDKFSEVLIYNFDTKKFKKIFNQQLKEEEFKTYTEGLSQILNDGSLFVEEQNHGRLILFNNKKQKEWEFVNKDINEDIGFVSWSKIIEDSIFIEKFKKIIQNKKC